MLQSLFGQFRDLATTDDGSQLYFSTFLRIRGSDQPLHPKIFVADANGVRLFASQDAQWMPSLNARISNYFSLSRPDVSGDGSIVAFTGERFCTGTPMACEDFNMVGEHYQATASLEWFTFNAPGKVSLSRDGRFALSYGGTGALSHGVYLTDLTTGQQSTLAPVSGDPGTHAGRRLVASDGTAVYLTYQGQLTLAVERMGSTQLLPVPPDTAAPAIDDQATTVLYTTGGQIVLLDLASWTASPLAQGSQPALSNDASVIVFLAGTPTQVWTIGRDGFGLRQLTGEPTGVLEVTLSGDGSTAYASTESNRILKIDVASGDTQEIIGRTPILAHVPVDGEFVVPGLASAPGSLVRLRGSGFIDDGSIGVSVNGTSYPVIAVLPDEVRFQVPWETAVSTAQAPVELTISNPPLFDGGAATIGIGPKAPAFWVEPADNPYPVVTHGDSGSPVTPDSPAVPGEILNFYMLGLGAVAPPVNTGEPSPSDPPATLIDPPQCLFFSYANTPPPEAAMISFAGLAPGLIGVYQVSMMLPGDVQGTQPLVSCSAGNRSTAIQIPVQAPASSLRE